MLPNARLTSSIVDEHGKHSVLQWSVDEFIAQTQPLFATQPFYEGALVNRVERFGNIAQVFTSYASRSEPGGKPFQRGINSMQCMTASAGGCSAYFGVSNALATHSRRPCSIRQGRSSCPRALEINREDHRHSGLEIR